MPGWGWLLIGVGCGCIIGYLSAVYYIGKNMFSGF